MRFHVFIECLNIHQEFMLISLRADSSLLAISNFLLSNIYILSQFSQNKSTSAPVPSVLVLSFPSML